MRKSLIIETLYEVSIVFRKESFINAKKVLNFIQSLTNKKKVLKSLTAFHNQPTNQPTNYYQQQRSHRTLLAPVQEQLGEIAFPKMEKNIVIRFNLLSNHLFGKS